MGSRKEIVITGQKDSVIALAISDVHETIKALCDRLVFRKDGS
jgi:hypothetical protein